MDSLEACKRLLDSLPGQREGLVIRDAFFNRVKLKRPDYVLLHSCTNGRSSPDYSWVARAAVSASHHMPVDRLCLNVWLRREASEFVAYFPEHRARYERISEALARIVSEGMWLPPGANPFARDGAGFAHEPRLARVIQLLVT